MKSHLSECWPMWVALAIGVSLYVLFSVSSNSIEQHQAEQRKQLEPLPGKAYSPALRLPNESDEQRFRFADR